MFKLEALDVTHDRAGFDCGVEALNGYLRRIARQHAAKEISKTYVLVDEAASPPKSIAGYFTLTICEGRVASLPAVLAKKLPEYLPAVRLGRLAVAREQQGQGIGQMLITAALVKVRRIADIAGCVGLFVDAKDDAAARYYQRFGFVPLVDAPLALFLPIRTIVEFVSRGIGPLGES